MSNRTKLIGGGIVVAAIVIIVGFVISTGSQAKVSAQDAPTVNPTATLSMTEIVGTSVADAFKATETNKTEATASQVAHETQFAKDFQVALTATATSFTSTPHPSATLTPSLTPSNSPTPTQTPTATLNQDERVGTKASVMVAGTSTVEAIVADRLTAFPTKTFTPTLTNTFTPTSTMTSSSTPLPPTSSSTPTSTATSTPSVIKTGIMVVSEKSKADVSYTLYVYDSSLPSGNSVILYMTAINNATQERTDVTMTIECGSGIGLQWHGQVMTNVAVRDCIRNGKNLKTVLDLSYTATFTLDGKLYQLSIV